MLVLTVHQSKTSPPSNDDLRQIDMAGILLHKMFSQLEKETINTTSPAGNLGEQYVDPTIRKYVEKYDADPKLCAFIDFTDSKSFTDFLQKYKGRTDLQIIIVRKQEQKV